MLAGTPDWSRSGGCQRFHGRAIWSPASEWEHWSQSEDRWTQIVMADSVRPIFEAGLVDLVDVHHVVHETIRFEPTPGHTPGHVSVHIDVTG